MKIGIFFRAALQANLLWLAVLGLLNSAVAAFYYLRLLVVMYMHEPAAEPAGQEPLTMGLRIALVLSAAGTLLLGIIPGPVITFVQQSTSFVK